MLFFFLLKTHGSFRAEIEMTTEYFVKKIQQLSMFATLHRVPLCIYRTFGFTLQQVLVIAFYMRVDRLVCFFFLRLCTYQTKSMPPIALTRLVARNKRSRCHICNVFLRFLLSSAEMAK